MDSIAANLMQVWGLPLSTNEVGQIRTNWKVWGNLNRIIFWNYDISGYLGGGVASYWPIPLIIDCEIFIEMQMKTILKEKRNSTGKICCRVVNFSTSLLNILFCISASVQN